jgi:hypothetical protein
VDYHARFRLADGGPIFDGYLPACFGDLSPAAAANGVPSDLADRLSRPAPPVDVPVIHLATQAEVELSGPTGAGARGRTYRRPDSDAADDRFRLYEVAGMPHGPTRGRSFGPGLPCDGEASQFPGAQVTANTLERLIHWVDQGVPPPRADRIVTDGPDGPIRMDGYGNALGGVRTTYVDVPIAQYGVSPTPRGEVRGTPKAFACALVGYQVPFTREQLRQLYPSPNEYINRVNQRLDALIQAGWYLEPEAEALRSEAMSFGVHWLLQDRLMSAAPGGPH